MAEEAAAARFSEDDFYCPICQEVFKTPVRTMNCQHVFCRKCFLTAMRESGTHCPLCRGSVTKKERSYPKRALDVENSMKKASGGCRCCEKQKNYILSEHNIKQFCSAQNRSGLEKDEGAVVHYPILMARLCGSSSVIDLQRESLKVRFSWMRQHYKTCKKYQDEYGVPSVIPKLQITQDSTGNSSRNDAVSANGEMATNQMRQGNTSGHPTFKCPLCQEANFTRQRLLDHCNNRHLYQIVPVICPICVSLPWADSSQVTRNLVSHLNLRHQFDYGEFVNYQLDEEAQYRNAVQESCHVNF
ncbi:E3 ubiquitin-protein ligase RNF138 isoform X2 [Lagopus muta]|uniref:E3 ubiquitin-protein ligase RNF138 isoform X2 n=1 Tax=Lagopus muta TaxID=64668 RepID=UPI0020A01D8C|nr:E3 ubiquitin-protein ligase RNF138 isoform X2 [Lagopus muta]